jgi:eukaryotic-like serine/threonine-protein kinase
VGLSAGDAEAELWNALFAARRVTVESDQPEGTVVSTNPAAGTEADWTTEIVTINVSEGPPPEPAPIPVPQPTPNGNDGNNGGGNNQNDGAENNRNNDGNNQNDNNGSNGIGDSFPFGGGND